jgi:hypothetical protein
MYWILPAFFYRAFLQPLGGKDIDWFFLVLFWGGNDPEEGRYFAFLPFAGRLKGLLGLDEADVLMFPLFARTLNGERRSLHILWPFFNRVSGGDWRGWRLWPFYGRYESRYRDGQPRYDRSFVLWPFYIRSHEQLNVNPTDLFFTFPFYGHRVNSRSDTRTYLWPFFQVHDDKKEGRRTYMGFIFPYRFTEGQTDAWPLFGFKETRRLNAPGGEIRHRRRHFILWPIERHDWAEDAREEMTRFWLMPVFWRYQTTDKEKAETDTEWKVWPLCLFRSKAGETAFDFISPLPLYRQDYDRYYGRLFALFRYRSTPALRGWELLYGLLMYRSEVGAAPAPGSGTGGEAAGPSGAGEAAREEAVFSVLGGLFACGRRNGSLVLRFLYIPWW